MNFTEKIKEEWEKDPVRLIVVSTLAVTAAAKLIDALSAAQGRRAYARQVDYRVNTRR